MCLTILWDWQLYGSDENKINNSEHFVDNKQEMLSLEGPLKMFYELRKFLKMALFVLYYQFYRCLIVTCCVSFSSPSEVGRLSMLVKSFIRETQYTSEKCRV